MYNNIQHVFVTSTYFHCILYSRYMCIYDVTHARPHHAIASQYHIFEILSVLRATQTRMLSLELIGPASDCNAIVVTEVMAALWQATTTKQQNYNQTTA